jgi:hypothetical protein
LWVEEWSGEPILEVVGEAEVGEGVTVALTVTGSETRDEIEDETVVTATEAETAVVVGTAGETVRAARDIMIEVKIEMGVTAEDAKIPPRLENSLTNCMSLFVYVESGLRHY